MELIEGPLSITTKVDWGKSKRITAYTFLLKYFTKIKSMCNITACLQLSCQGFGGTYCLKIDSKTLLS